MPDLIDLREQPPRSWSRPSCRRFHSGRDYVDLRDLRDERHTTPPAQPAEPTHGAAQVVQRIYAAMVADEDDAVDCIYSEVDELLRAESFSVVDELLGLLDTSKLTVVHLLAFVSITCAARDDLFARSAFVARVRKRLTEIEPERIEDLLAGIE